MGGKYNDIIANKIQVKKVPTKIVTADATLGAGDSGKMILMGANGVDITLPAAELGMNFKVVLNADYDTAVCTVVAQSGDFLAGAVTAGDAAAELFNGTSHLTATFGSASQLGDHIDIVSNGTVWFIGGFCADGGANGIAAS